MNKILAYTRSVCKHNNDHANVEKDHFERMAMDEIKRILFSPHLYIGRGITILRIDNFELPSGPLLKYALDGQEVKDGLRVRICSGLLNDDVRLLILDYPKDPVNKQVLKAAIPRITAHLAIVYTKAQLVRNQKTRV